MATPRVLVALSGGVDSSVAAALLVREGYDVAAVFYELWSPTPKKGKGWENNCCTLEAYKDAQRVTEQLGIPLFRVNLEKEFRQRVVQYFLDEYAAGRTPNPCVVCNTDMRFGLMFNRALAHYKADYVATGHYAIRDAVDSWQRTKLVDHQGPHRLFEAVDTTKDQGYFLYRLPQTVLARLLFPLGGMRKATEVRALARELKLPSASKHDSQEICFVPRGGVGQFLQEYLGPQPATVKDVNGQVLGTSVGAPVVTVGQRRGIGSFGTKPHFVVEKNLEQNSITVTTNPSDERLFAARFELESVHWINDAPKKGLNYAARGRNGQQPFAVRVIGIDVSGRCTVLPLVRQRVIAPGQSLVILRGTEVLGGGIVRQAKSYATLQKDELSLAHV